MNHHLQIILDVIQQAEHLSAEEKAALSGAAKDADKELEATVLKLERTEKVKHTTAILLEEAIVELEEKRKAVASQNRELEIESALEKVRSRSLAMHSSSELKDVVKVVFEKLKELDFGIDGGPFIITQVENSKDINIWIGDDHAEYPTSFRTPFFETPVILDIRNAKESGTDFFSRTYSFEVKNPWFKYAFENTDYKTLPDELKKWILEQKFLTQSFAIAKNSAIGIHFHHQKTLSEIEIDILKRFSRVFEQAYTRFLDLQKAEAQAKEVQIQLGLERVRARTMAMQHSDELPETAAVLFGEFKKLGEEDLIQATIAIYHEEEGIMEFHSTSWAGGGEQVSRPFNLSIEEPTVLKPVFTAWKAKEKSCIFDLTGEALDGWIRYRNKMTGVTVSREDTDGRRVIGAAFFSKGHLSIGSPKLFSQESIKTLERFAGVFDGTYTRFLDLKKAEAQAREAKIEASLERVRSRSMGMQKSEELKEVIQVVYDQFVHLNIQVEHTGFIMDYKERSDMHIWLADIHAVPFQVIIPYFDCAHWNSFNEAKEKGIDFFANHLGFEEKNRFYQDLFKLIPGVPEETLEYYFSCPGLAISTVLLENVGLYIENFSGISYTDQENNTLMRFGKVFQQTYTRFLDLQKAEAQTREAQIEAALEKVRARAMAMQSSEDVVSATSVLFGELEKLGIKTMRCGILVIDESQTMEVWTSVFTKDAQVTRIIGKLDMTIHPLLSGIFRSWKQKEEIFSYKLIGDDIHKYYSALAKAYDPYSALAQDPNMPDHYCHFYYFDEGGLYTFSVDAHKDETRQIIKKFTAVFSLTFRRYQDLKHAEAQAREARIEASLERVRSKTMAMHNSQDVGDTVATLFDELVKLGVETNRCGILIFSDRIQAEVWTAKSNAEGKATLITGQLDMWIHPLLQEIYNAWKKKESFYSYTMAGDDLKKYYQAINNFQYYPTRFDLDSLPSNEIHSDFYFAEGSIFAFTAKPITPEASQIFKRFAGVFGQTYRRYLDLQKAEAQAREAQIEAGLERVRAKTMAMHSSEDVSTATATMFTELEKLGIENFRCGITNIRMDQTQEVWSVNNLDKGKIVRAVGKFDMNIHPFWERLYKGWEQKEEFFHYYLAGKEKEDYVKILNTAPNYFSQPIVHFPDTNIQAYYFAEGSIWTFSLKPHTEEDKQVMKKFTSVFSLTFRRYQDLKKAEAQAREAKIETAMEKVRARAMAMQKPDELVQVAELLRKEMGLLGVEELETSSIYIHNPATGKMEGWYAIMKVDEHENKLISDHMTVDLNQTAVGRQMLEFYHSGKRQISIPMQGAGRKEWISYCTENSKISVGFYGDDIPDRTYHLYKFSNGYIGAASPGDISAESWGLLQRATTVFSLAYTRFSDLQQAEASTREAVRQASVDRVRAEIASMRSTTDLERITPLIWNELTIIGIPFIRCGVFIMDNSQELIHTFLSAPDGKAIAAFHLPYTTPGNLGQVLRHWEDKKSYIDHWKETAFTELADILVKQGSIASPGQYLDTLPRGGFYLHFLPFLQGMLYVGNTTRLGDEEIKLIQSVADAFSTAYARYEDFNKLEAAKKQVDSTLNELQVTQKQLIQSEKMASLGELTAGIAHEIQNPLNFVNNFSELNKELLGELNEEIEKGNYEEVKIIAKDVAGNEEKISHHGKRADAIVKGMLQHSRSSSATKEPTDINKLADEYLRLAYHGLRAKDNTFNATLKTDYDTTIGNISIIPQDIGRAVLNLITNAFYAIKPPNPLKGEQYEPTVSLSTKKIGDKVLISVKDNGDGIPRKVIDKIFQPFFTTKPTGEGTGLGLSLSYDIIKAHGGEIKVDSKEGEGSEFIILLPLNA